MKWPVTAAAAAVPEMPAQAPAGVPVDEYFGLLGMLRPSQPDLASLVAIARRHVEVVPFHNLDLQSGEPAPLTTDGVLHEVVANRRGGTCFELNGALGALLSVLGFHVELLAGRVHQPGDGALGIPFGHLALRVVIPGSDPAYLIDVGFGDRWAVVPLAADAAGRPGGFGDQVWIAPAGDGLDVGRGARPWYRLDPRPRSLGDFDAAKWYLATGPATRFNRSLVCSIATSDGRITLAGRRLVHVTGGSRRESTVATDDELLACYLGYFGLRLDTPPRPRRAAVDELDWFGEPLDEGRT